MNCALLCSEIHHVWCDTQKTSLFNAAYLLSCHFSIGFLFCALEVYYCDRYAALPGGFAMWPAVSEWGSDPPWNTGWIVWYNTKEYGANKAAGKAIQQRSHLSGLQRHDPAWNTRILHKTENVTAVWCSLFHLYTLTRVNMRAQERQVIPPAHSFL